MIAAKTAPDEEVRSLYLVRVGATQYRQFPVVMGKIRRGGYTFIWWIGDHPPRHVHVFDKTGRLITRVNLETMRPMDIPKIERRILDLIRELQNEGRL